MVFKPEPFRLYESKTRGKKYDIYVPYGDGKIKRVAFGASGYDDYTTHYRRDPGIARERRRLYRIRHAGDRLNDPLSAGYWSWYVLWNKETVGKSLEDAVDRAKKLLK